MSLRRAVCLFAMCGVGSGLGGPVDASNGMNMIGYGAQSIGMGGADLAVIDSSSAMNINPAGIGRSLRREVGFAFGMVYPSVSHSDRLGNDTEDVLDRYPMPFIGYIHPRGDFTFGIGFFVQGGMGAEYQGLVTPFSAMMASGALPPEYFGRSTVSPTDRTRTNLAHAKLTPTIAWRARPGLSLGASLNVSYAEVDMELFPETSVMADLNGSGVAGDHPNDFFFGLDAEDVSGVGYGLRVGFLYEVGSLAVGGSYSTETDLELDGGTMAMNLSALGLGKVAYDCELSGLTWPRQAGLGLAYRYRRLLVAFDADWVDWSSAISTITINVDSPSSAQAPAARQIPLRMGWHDQWVWAAGLELTPRDRWALRLGYNYGESPIPAAMLRPLFPAIAEGHLTGGVGYASGPWHLDMAVEYALDTAKTNDNPDPTVNPLGPGSRESLSQLTAHLMLRKAF